MRLSTTMRMIFVRRLKDVTLFTAFFRSAVATESLSIRHTPHEITYASSSYYKYRPFSAARSDKFYCRKRHVALPSYPRDIHNRNGLTAPCDRYLGDCGGV